MEFVVDLDMYKSIVGDGRLVGVGPVLGTISCEDPQNMRYLVLHVVDPLWDVFA